MVIFYLSFGVFVLFLWLSGHWFGRVLVTLALVALAWTMAMVTIPGYSECYLAFGLPMAWIVGSAPIWVIQHRAKQLPSTKALVPYPGPWG